MASEQHQRLWHYTNANPSNGQIPYLAVSEVDDRGRQAWLAVETANEPALKEIAANLVKEFTDSWPLPADLTGGSFFEGLLELINENLRSWWQDAGLSEKEAKKFSLQVGLVDYPNLYLGNIGELSGFLVNDEAIIRLTPPAVPKNIPQFAEVISGHLEEGQSLVTLPPLDEPAIKKTIKEIFEDSEVDDDLNLVVILPAAKPTAPANLLKIKIMDGVDVPENTSPLSLDQEEITATVETFTRHGGSKRPRAWLLAALRPLVRWWTEQNKDRRRVVLFLSLGLLVLSTSLVLTGYQKIAANNLRGRQALADEISATQNKAQSALLYDDRQKAADLLSQAQQLINQLPDQGELTDEQLKLRNQVRKVNTVNNPTVAGLVGNGYTDLTWVNGQIAATGSDQKIATIRAGSKQMQTGNELLDNYRLAAASGDKILFTSDKETQIIDTKTGTSRKVALPVVLNGARAMATYGNHWYWLDKTGQKIYKNDLFDNGWTEPKSWLKNNARLSIGATGLTVDINLYLLLENGALQKFYQGSSQNWKVDPIEPLPTGGQLKTIVGGKNLYLVDTTNQRVIIITKGGQLVSQLVSTSFSGLSSAVPDPTEKNLYLLAGQNIYQIPL